MIMYRVRELFVSGISLQEKEVVKLTDKTITFIDKYGCEMKEHKENRSTKWFDNFNEAKIFAVTKLELQIKEHSRHLECSQLKLSEILELGESK